MILDLVDELKEGYVVGEKRIYAEQLPFRRFREEINLQVLVEKSNKKRRMFYMTVFLGRKPHYRPWVEIYGVNNYIELDGEIIEFYNTEIESTLLSKISQHMNGGESLFVEYVEDKETSRELFHGIPVYATRLGYKLFNLGYTWMKNWYFPEGGYEGGLKIQAEKPETEEQRQKHLRVIEKQIKEFLAKETERGKDEIVERCENLLKKISEMMKS